MPRGQPLKTWRVPARRVRTPSSPPYTLFVDENTRAGRRREVRMASRISRVPPALMAKSSRGSATDVVTATWPALWMTRSASFTSSARRRRGHRISPRTMRTREPWEAASQRALAWAPGREKLSKTVTRAPARRKPSETLEPMKPAPPVTSTRVGTGILRSGGVSTVQAEDVIAARPHRLDEREVPGQERIDPGHQLDIGAAAAVEVENVRLDDCVPRVAPQPPLELGCPPHAGPMVAERVARAGEYHQVLVELSEVALPARQMERQRVAQEEDPLLAAWYDSGDPGGHRAQRGDLRLRGHDAPRQVRRAMDPRRDDGGEKEGGRDETTRRRGQLESPPRRREEAADDDGEKGSDGPHVRIALLDVHSHGDELPGHEIPEKPESEPQARGSPQGRRGPPLPRPQCRERPQSDEGDHPDRIAAQEEGEGIGHAGEPSERARIPRDVRIVGDPHRRGILHEIVPGVVAHGLRPRAQDRHVREHPPVLTFPPDAEEGDGDGHGQQTGASRPGARAKHGVREGERNGRPVMGLHQEEDREDGHGEQIARGPRRTEEDVNGEERERGHQRREVRRGEVAHDETVGAEEAACRHSRQPPAPARRQREA